MARPIIPTAIRRQTAGGPIEIRTAAGLWVPYRMASGAAIQEVGRRLTAQGLNLPNVCADMEAWFITLGEVPPTRPTPPAPPTDQDSDQKLDSDERDTDSDSDSDDERDGDEQDDKPQPPRPPQPQDGSMEDIVRRIAGQMDDNVKADIGELLHDLRDEFCQKLDEFEPKNTNGPTTLTTITTRVELIRPDLPDLPKDGLFHRSFDDLLANMVAGIHSFLPGPPGTGKSHSAEQAAEMLGWKFGALSLGPTTPESRLWGGMDANGRFVETPLLACIRYAMENPDSGATYCLDEMDNAHAGILATMNSAMANGWVFAPNGDRLTLGSNMVFVAAANTFGTGPTAEFSGRNKLDAATLDRFSYLPWDTDLGVEEALVRQRLEPQVASQWLDVWRTLRANVQTNGLKFFITMRGCINGAKIIAAGRPMDKALMLVAGNKFPADQWKKVNPL